LEIKLPLRGEGEHMSFADPTADGSAT
jgi:hypothetical protein